ncbi:hypothetical protein N0V90_004277 [Kalmusia sp. IMI 367209]|nr:hypothetical protein N0V90_004277 [Kalmusia sp. IMI 367209]
MGDGIQQTIVSYMPVQNPNQQTAAKVQKRSASDLIGVYGLIVLALGSVVLVAAVAFLAVFWHVSLQAVQDRPVPHFWMSIVRSGRIATTVTITSVFIRTAISLQAGLSSSMIAAVVLERRGTSLWKLPILSIIRTVSVSPQVLAWPMLRRPFRNIPVLHTIGILIMLAITVISQFTSTILLLDFAEQVIPLPQNITELPYGFHSDDTTGVVNTAQSGNFWITGPSVFPRFAEISEKVIPTEGVVDTGPSTRAFLPFPRSSSRSVLRSFSGPARVMHSRFVCVRPTLTNLALEYVNDSEPELFRFVTGTVAVGVNTSMLMPPGFDDALPSVKFNCTVILPSQGTWKANQLWRASLCLIDTMGRINAGPQDDGGISTTFLVFNTTGLTAQSWEQGSLEEWPISQSGAWTTATGTAGDFALILSASLCFTDALDGTLDQAYNVTLQSHLDFVEPPLELDLVNIDYAPISDKVLHMFCGGACTSMPEQKRGILTLDPPSNLTTARLNQTSSLTDAMAQGFWGRNDMWKGANRTLILAMNSYGVNRGHVAVLGTILRRTENPALALQYLFTAVAQMAFYDVMPFFNAEGQASTVFSEEFVVPRRWTGLAVIAVLVFVHIVLVGGVLIVFLLQTKISFLGNSWMAVAQVLQENTEDTLGRASVMTDSEVRKLLVSEGKERIVLISGGTMHRRISK